MIEIVKVVVFDKATGKILSTGATCLPEKLETGTIGVLKNSSADIEGDYVHAGVVVSKGVQPTPNHVFDFTCKQWLDPRTSATQWAFVRTKRDGLLLVCDWTQLPDVPDTTKSLWATYRQSLRNITQQPDPFNIEWPNPPN